MVVTCLCVRVCVCVGGEGLAWGLRLCVSVWWGGVSFSSLLYRVRLVLSKGKGG